MKTFERKQLLGCWESPLHHRTGGGRMLPPQLQPRKKNFKKTLQELDMHSLELGRAGLDI